MKIKPTFFNTRNGCLHWDNSDTNSRLLRIILSNGKELNFIYRDLLKEKIDSKRIIYNIFGKNKIEHIELDRLSKTEYDMLKNLGTSTLNNVNIKQIY